MYEVTHVVWRSYSGNSTFILIAETSYGKVIKISDEPLDGNRSSTSGIGEETNVLREYEYGGVLRHVGCCLSYLCTTLLPIWDSTVNPNSLYL